MRSATIDLLKSLTNYRLLIGVVYILRKSAPFTRAIVVMMKCGRREVYSEVYDIPPRAFLRGYSESGVNRQKVAETASGLGLAGRYMLTSSQAHSTYGRMGFSCRYVADRRSYLPSRRENEIKRTDKTPHHHVQ